VRRPPLLGDGIAMKPDEFRLLRDLFATRTGLNFGPEARFALERRLRERLLVLKLSSFAEYHHYLRYGLRADAEWDEAVDLLTTNETYFFREDRQLRAFQQELLPMLQQQTREQRRLSIWSAGCSTGEEAYTVAILVHQSGLFYPRRRIGGPPAWMSAQPSAAERPPTRPSAGLQTGPSAGERPHTGLSAAERPQTGLSAVEDPTAWDVRIYGSDISRRCVAAARRGVYGESSFRATSDELRRAFFVERGDGWHVVDSVRQLCHFGQTNLLDDRSHVLGRADAIFCRNVLIYFDARARKTAIEALYERLNPGGVLLLGHSESLLNVSTAFELLHLKEDLVYRKPISARGPQPSLDESS
jgi:chemotaxis protein methyltransferase CheR